MSAQAVLLERDVLALAFARRDPHPLVVHRFDVGVRSRRLFCCSAVRQAVLAATADDAAFNRLSLALAPFPDLPVHRSHVLRAAGIEQRFARDRLEGMDPVRALCWALAEDGDLVIWSRHPAWESCARLGAPVDPDPLPTGPAASGLPAGNL